MAHRSVCGLFWLCFALPLTAAPAAAMTLALSTENGSGFVPEDANAAPSFAVVQAASSSKPAAPAEAPNSAAPMPKPSAAALAMKPGDVAGHYAIEREPGKQVGCLLNLDDQAKSQGRNKASLAPGCRDEGIMVFDPVGWRLAKGRLVLTARRGHTVEFDLQPNHTWLKAQGEGKLLILKKL